MLLLLAGACADAHLSEGYGRRTRAALDAQADTRSKTGYAIDGDDAKLVMQKHRGRGVPAALGGSGTTQGGMGGAAGGAAGQGTPYSPSGQIRLDATR